MAERADRALEGLNCGPVGALPGDALAHLGLGRRCAAPAPADEGAGIAACLEGRGGKGGRAARRRMPPIARAVAPPPPIVGAAFRAWAATAVEERRRRFAGMWADHLWRLRLLRRVLAAWRDEAHGCSRRGGAPGLLAAPAGGVGWVGVGGQGV